MFIVYLCRKIISQKQVKYRNDFRKIIVRGETVLVTLIQGILEVPPPPKNNKKIHGEKE